VRLELAVATATAVAYSGCHRRPHPVGPPGDCAAVAEALASFELGNYATADERKSVVARYRDGCDDAAISADEQRCITAAADGWSAKQCAPRMFPELTASHDAGECKQLVDHIRRSVVAQGQDDALTRWAKRELDIEETACVEDGWPDAFKACALGSGTGPECRLPEPLQRSLQARINAAFAK
jgi:hypothetical protein